jgi:hypothetical protein
MIWCVYPNDMFAEINYLRMNINPIKETGGCCDGLN